MTHRSPCQISRLGLRQLRSTFAQKASSHSTLAATAAASGASGFSRDPVVPERAGQEVDAQVEPGTGVDQVLDLLVRLVAGDLGVQVERHQPRRAQPDPARELAHDHLGDQHPDPLAGAAELADVGAQVVGLHDPGQRAALAQGRDVADDPDGRDHEIGGSSSSRCFCSAHVEVGRGPLEVEPPQRLEQQVADGEVAEPLLVRRDDVPGRRLGVGALEGDLVGVAVLGPPSPLVDVAGVELPVLGRVVEAGEQPLLLLGRGDVQHALEDRGALRRPDAARSR